MAQRPPSRWAVVSPLLLSWLVVAAAPWLAVLMPWRPDDEPVLPIVGVIPWDRTSDVMSSIPGLFKALLVGGFGALIVEAAKVSLPRTSRVSYSLLLGYQLVLVSDALRAYGRDWWAWLTFWLRLRSRGLEWFDPSLGVPWPSLLVMLSVALYLWREQTRRCTASE